MIRFNLKEIIPRVLSFIDASFKNNGITTDLQLSEDITVLGHPNEYTQVLLNILNNTKEALTAQKTSDRHVEIKAFSEDNKAVVTIKDNGGGIPENIIDRIFDPYFTTKNWEKGTGIGLYMSKMIIEKNMNGELTARNVDNGAEFRIEVLKKSDY